MQSRDSHEKKAPARNTRINKAEIGWHCGSCQRRPTGPAGVGGGGAAIGQIRPPPRLPLQSTPCFTSPHWSIGCCHGKPAVTTSALSKQHTIRYVSLYFMNFFGETPMLPRREKINFQISLKTIFVPEKFKCGFLKWPGFDCLFYINDICATTLIESRCFTPLW